MSCCKYKQKDTSLSPSKIDESGFEKKLGKAMKVIAGETACMICCSPYGV